MFKIALLEINNEDADFLEKDHSTDAEMDDFFKQTQAGTLRVIHAAQRKERALRVLKTELPRVTRIVAVLLLFVYIGATIAIAAVPDVRLSLGHFLIQTNEEYTSLSLAENSDLTFSVPGGWLGAYFPSYIPGGFEMQPFDPNNMRVYYLNSAGDLLDFAEYTQDDYVNIDTEDAVIQNIQINDRSAILSVKGGRVKVAWSDADRYFVLTLDGDSDTAMRIVNSVERIE